MTLVIPEHYLNYRVMGCDPGGRTGISVFDIDLSTRTLKSIEAFTINTEKLPNYTGLDEEYFGERLIRLYKLKMYLQSLIQQLRPQAVACESPFYNRLRPMAYGSLLEVLSYIHAAVIETDPSIFFKTIEPLVAKKAIGAGIMKGKVDVRVCIESNPSIMSILKNDVDLLDEHALDSIAISFAFINNSGILV